MAETNISPARVGKASPIHATFFNGESVSASVELGCEEHEVAINISTRADAYHLLLTGEGAIDLALRIIAVVGRLRNLERPTD